MSPNIRTYIVCKKRIICKNVSVIIYLLQVTLEQELGTYGSGTHVYTLYSSLKYPLITKSVKYKLIRL